MDDGVERVVPRVDGAEQPLVLSRGWVYEGETLAEQARRMAKAIDAGGYRAVALDAARFLHACADALEESTS